MLPPVDIWWPTMLCDRGWLGICDQLRHPTLNAPTLAPTGYCGLVQVRDEDFVRPDSAQNTAAAAAPPLAGQQAPAEQAQQRRQQRQQHSAVPLPHPRHAAGWPAGGARTPPSASPRSSPGSSPFKPGPGALLGGKQSASVLAEQVRAALGWRLAASATCPAGC